MKDTFVLSYLLCMILILKCFVFDMHIILLIIIEQCEFHLNKYVLLLRDHVNVSKSFKQNSLNVYS